MGRGREAGFGKEKPWKSFPGKDPFPGLFLFLPSPHFPGFFLPPEPGKSGNFQISKPQNHSGASLGIPRRNLPLILPVLSFPFIPRVFFSLFPDFPLSPSSPLFPVFPPLFPVFPQFPPSTKPRRIYPPVQDDSRFSHLESHQEPSQTPLEIQEVIPGPENSTFPTFCRQGNFGMTEFPHPQTPL